MTAEVINGTILGVRDCGTLMIVYLGNEDGRIAPIAFDRRPFERMLDGEGCNAEELIGRNASYDGESLSLD